MSWEKGTSIYAASFSFLAWQIAAREGPYAELSEPEDYLADEEAG